jgi:hypothetical protein
VTLYIKCPRELTSENWLPGMTEEEARRHIISGFRKLSNGMND